MIKKPIHVTISRELYEKSKIYGINLSQTLEEALREKIQKLGFEIEISNYKEERKNGWIVRCPHCANEFKTLSLFPYCPKCRVQFLVLYREKKQWIFKRIVKIPKEVFPVFIEKVKRYYPQLYQKIKDLDISKILASPTPQP